MKTGIFTGTFDPFTVGHADVVERALPLFDKLVIAVAVSKLKHTSDEIAERVESIRSLYKDDARVSVISYSDLTIDMAARVGAQFIVRGVRSVKDFEYEREQADFNRRVGHLETVLIFARPEFEGVSSSLVRELRFFGHDVSDMLPRKK